MQVRVLFALHLNDSPMDTPYGSEAYLLLTTDRDLEWEYCPGPEKIRYADVSTTEQGSCRIYRVRLRKHNQSSL
jgi:hypothetical protein